MDDIMERDKTGETRDEMKRNKKLAQKPGDRTSRIKSGFASIWLMKLNAKLGKQSTDTKPHPKGDGKKSGENGSLIDVDTLTGRQVSHFNVTFDAFIDHLRGIKQA